MVAVTLILAYACDDSWSSLDCAIRNMVCPTVVVNASCSGHGTCDTTVGVCECDMMWCGEACERCNNCQANLHVVVKDTAL